MGPVRMRAGLILGASSLSLFALVRTELPGSLSGLISLCVIGLAVHAWRRRPALNRLDRIDDGRIRLHTANGRTVVGAFEPDYCSGFYCAFTLHDPLNGSQRYGLFRDELDADAWRRLRVALRTQGRD